MMQYSPNYVIESKGIATFALHIINAGEAIVSKDGREFRRLHVGGYFGGEGMIRQPSRYIVFSQNSYV